MQCRNGGSGGLVAGFLRSCCMGSEPKGEGTKEWCRCAAVRNQILACISTFSESCLDLAPAGREKWLQGSVACPWSTIHPTGSRLTQTGSRLSGLLPSPRSVNSASSAAMAALRAQQLRASTDSITWIRLSAAATSPCRWSDNSCHRAARAGSRDMSAILFHSAGGLELNWSPNPGEPNCL
jgi:hypothetical protein